MSFHVVSSTIFLICVRYVGKMSRKESESAEEFGVRVQAATASALQLRTSNHTVSDKVCITRVLVHLV